MESQQKKIAKLLVTVQKPNNMIFDEFEIFSQTYFGKLTNIVDYFETFGSQEKAISLMSSRDERGNTPFDIGEFTAMHILECIKLCLKHQ